MLPSLPYPCPLCPMPRPCILVVLQMLLNAGAELNYEITSGAGKGKTAVQLAADLGNVDCVCILLAVGARSKPMTDLIGTAIANAASKKTVCRRAFSSTKDSPAAAEFHTESDESFGPLVDELANQSAKTPTRADATTAIQSWWRNAHATRLQRTTGAALLIQAWCKPPPPPPSLPPSPRGSCVVGAIS